MNWKAEVERLCAMVPKASDTEKSAKKVSAVYTVSVDISEEDVPTLMVAKNGTSGAKTVVNTIQGKTAEQLHKYLTGELDVMTPEEALEWIKSECPIDSDDEEVNHIKADEILCHLLADLGYKEVAEYFGSLRKWYA